MLQEPGFLFLRLPLQQRQRREATSTRRRSATQERSVIFVYMGLSRPCRAILSFSIRHTPLCAQADLVNKRGDR